jgi:hypothetical protein
LTTSPAAPYAGVSAVFDNPRLEVEPNTETVADEEFDVTVASCGLIPDAVAVLVTDPESTSAWLTV